MRLSEFKQVLSRAGISSEFNAGILWCANGTLALKKVSNGGSGVLCACVGFGCFLCVSLVWFCLHVLTWLFCVALKKISGSGVLCACVDFGCFIYYVSFV